MGTYDLDENIDGSEFNAGLLIGQLAKALNDLDLRVISGGGGGGGGVTSYTELTDIPTEFNPAPHEHDADDIVTGTLSIARSPAGIVGFVVKSGSSWGARPTSRTDILVIWVGPDPSPPIVSSGTGGMIDNLDVRMVTAS